MGSSVRTGPELPHDLLDVATPTALAWFGPPPGWVRTSLARAPVVVVRRTHRRDGLLPVGVRGASRDERFAAWVAPPGVVRRIRPEDLAVARAWRGGRRVPQLAALEVVARILEPRGFAWGPVGSAGFELATGIACVGPASDLDLVLRAPVELPRDEAGRLLASLGALDVSVDVQLETPRGAVSLAEYASGASRIALRTRSGPRLVADPWSNDGASPSA